MEEQGGGSPPGPQKGGRRFSLPRTLGQAFSEKAIVKALVSEKSLQIMDLEETVEKEEVIAILSGALVKPDLDGPCWLYTRFGGVRTTVVRRAHVLLISEQYKRSEKSLWYQNAS